jgi:hypothetical protein
MLNVSSPKYRESAAYLLEVNDTARPLAATKGIKNAEPAETQRSGRIHEERKKAGKDLLAEPLFLPSRFVPFAPWIPRLRATAGQSLGSSFNLSFAPFQAPVVHGRVDDGENRDEIALKPVRDSIGKVRRKR